RFLVELWPSAHDSPEWRGIWLGTHGLVGANNLDVAALAADPFAGWPFGDGGRSGLECCAGGGDWCFGHWLECGFGVVGNPLANRCAVRLWRHDDRYAAGLDALATQGQALVRVGVVHRRGAVLVPHSVSGRQGSWRALRGGASHYELVVRA